MVSTLPGWRNTPAGFGTGLYTPGPAFKGALFLVLIDELREQSGNGVTVALTGIGGDNHDLLGLPKPVWARPEPHRQPGGHVRVVEHGVVNIVAMYGLEHGIGQLFVFKLW
jgi:hypothetical protein